MQIFWLPLHNGIDNCRHNCIAKCSLMLIRWRLCMTQNCQRTISFLNGWQSEKDSSNLAKWSYQLKAKHCIDSCLHSQQPTHTNSINSLAFFNSLLHDFRYIFIESVHKLFGAIILKWKLHTKKQHEKKRDCKRKYDAPCDCCLQREREVFSGYKELHSLKAHRHTNGCIYTESNIPYPLSSIEHLM